jgi:hypothetical protein
MVETMDKIEKKLDSKDIVDGYIDELKTLKEKHNSLLSVDTDKMTSEESMKHLESLRKLEVEAFELSERIEKFNSTKNRSNP